MRVRFSGRQGGRRVDLVLGLLLLAGVLTGLGANTIGVNWPLDLIQLHAAGALAILLLAPWKYVVIRRGLRRTRGGRPIKRLSMTLAAFVLITIASGLIHSTGHLEHVGPLTLMQIHVGAAVTALAVLAAHFGPTWSARAAPTSTAGRCSASPPWARGPRPRPRSGTADPVAGRRFTGSVRKARLLVTAWLDDRIQRIDPGAVDGAGRRTTFDLGAVLALPHERFTAVLDCTSGWYSEQQWDGVRLSVLLAAAGVTRTAGAASRPAR